MSYIAWKTIKLYRKHIQKTKNSWYFVSIFFVNMVKRNELEVVIIKILRLFY